MHSSMLVEAHEKDASVQQACSIPDFSKHKVFIDPGVLPEYIFSQILKNSPGDFNLITEDTSLYKKYSNLLGEDEVFLYPQKMLSGSNDPVYTDDSLSIWHSIIDDHQTYLLYDRAYTGAKSSQLKTADIISDCIKCQNFIGKYRPGVLIFMATPHKIETWIFSRVAELMGVDVYYFQETIMPWRQYIYKGISRKASMVRFGFEEIKDQKAIDGFVEAKKSGFDEAFPETEKIKLRRNNGKFYNFLTDAIHCWKHPLNIWNKYLCYKKYSNICYPGSLPDKYVVYFLHYQPERTSLPEGYGFAQQLVVIKLLQSVLPEGYCLVIKEHPSIFTALCSWKERRPSWYEQLGGENIMFAPMEQDAYGLIDNSLAVSTLTGTVAGEALIRGKPAVVFGAGPALHIKHDALHKFIDSSSLKYFLKKISEEGSVGLKKDANDFLVDVARDSFSGLPDDVGYDYADKNYESVRFQGIFNAYKHILRSEKLL